MNQRPAASSPSNTSNNDTISPGEVSVTPCDNTWLKERTDQNEWPNCWQEKEKEKEQNTETENDKAQSNPNDLEDSVPGKISTALLIGDYDKKISKVQS